MGSKIRPPGTSMGPFFFQKTWYFDGSIFQNFLKFAPKWRKFGTLIGQLFKIFRNLRQNGANFSEKFWFLVHGWVTFPSKWVHGWVAFQKSQRHTPTQTKVEYPPGDGSLWVVLKMTRFSGIYLVLWVQVRSSVRKDLMAACTVCVCVCVGGGGVGGCGVCGGVCVSVSQSLSVSNF